MPQFGTITGLTFVARIPQYYTMHERLHMAAHVLIENTLVQQKMAKNSLVELCCQNPEYRCTGLDYGFHSHASAFAHGASVMVLCHLKKRGGEEERISTKINDILVVFRLAT